jgi:hypothetical protein
MRFVAIFLRTNVTTYWFDRLNGEFRLGLKFLGVLWDGTRKLPQPILVEWLGSESIIDCLAICFLKRQCT